MLHARIDTIMFGCLMALLWDNERFSQAVQPLLRGWVAAAAGLFILLGDPLLTARFGGKYTLPVGITLDTLFISILLLYAVRRSQAPFGRFLNTAVLRHIGVISYSLYLWQQMFTRENSVRFFPWNLLAILACAELSYFLIERPSFRLRDRLQRSMGKPIQAHALSKSSVSS
jgi:peptidoglycan/LPS O-acetylase OafA/YrhL